VERSGNLERNRGRVIGWGARGTSAARSRWIGHLDGGTERGKARDTHRQDAAVRKQWGTAKMAKRRVQDRGHRQEERRGVRQAIHCNKKRGGKGGD